MDKDSIFIYPELAIVTVSTLVLMDSWIKTDYGADHLFYIFSVSTLVLMDSWIKTMLEKPEPLEHDCFNPCFNGFMDKDKLILGA